MMKTANESGEASAERVELWDIGRLMPNPLNPRGEIVPETLDELAASISEKGILTPLLVTPYRAAAYIVAGHRRRAAALLAGLRKLPVIVHRFTEREQLEIMLVENLQREDLTPIQEARAYESALADGTRKADLARRIGINAQRITSRLDLLRLDPAVQKIFDRMDLPVTLAGPLLVITDPHEQRRMASIAMQRMLTVDELQVIIKRRAAAPAPRIKGAGAKKAPPPAAMPPIPGAITRSEAKALLDREGAVAFASLGRALDVSCDGCDEKNYPEICRACPLPQFVSAVLREAINAR